MAHHVLTSVNAFETRARQTWRARWLQMVVTVGVAIASYGEINLVVIGVVLQLISVATESTRLTLVQILLQVRFPQFSHAATYFLTQPPACQCTISHYQQFAAPCSPAFSLAWVALMAHGVGQLLDE